MKKKRAQKRIYNLTRGYIILLIHYSNDDTARKQLLLTLDTFVIGQDVLVTINF